MATPPVDLEYVEVLQPDHLPADTLRIVVFGPGQGEAVVVMLPEGGVGVVDGCREPERGNSEGRGDPVRELLNAIPTLQASDARLDFVCLTHPHSDHFGGLGHLLHRWGRRTHRLWMVEPLGLRWSNAWEQWLSVHVDGREPGGDNPLKRMLEEVQDLLTAGAIKLEDLGGGKRVLKRSEGGADLEIWSCAPSSNDLHHVRQAFIVASRGGNGSHVDPNQTSAALLLRWGEAQVLLGGDLLVGSSPNSGWNAARGERWQQARSCGEGRPSRFRASSPSRTLGFHEPRPGHRHPLQTRGTKPASATWRHPAAPGLLGESRHHQPATMGRSGGSAPTNRCLLQTAGLGFHSASHRHTRPGGSGHLQCGRRGAGLVRPHKEARSGRRR